MFRLKRMEGARSSIVPAMSKTPRMLARRAAQGSQAAMCSSSLGSLAGASSPW
jgi:hypothetical protein